MGYSTDLFGSLKLNKQLSLDDKTYLEKFSSTRRMARNFPNDEYGVEGEFFVDGEGDFGQGKEDNIIDYNRYPITQPGLWCQWVPSEDGWSIQWDGNEKFYNYVEWLEYVIDKILAPKGYVLNGTVDWQGEETEDIGRIVVIDNVVKVQEGYVAYKPLDGVDNHTVYRTIENALLGLGMKNEGGGDSNTGGIETVYSIGDYKVTVEIRN